MVWKKEEKNQWKLHKETSTENFSIAIQSSSLWSSFILSPKKKSNPLLALPHGELIVSSGANRAEFPHMKVIPLSAHRYFVFYSISNCLHYKSELNLFDTSWENWAKVLFSFSCHFLRTGILCVSSWGTLETEMALEWVASKGGMECENSKKSSKEWRGSFFFSLQDLYYPSAMAEFLF